MEQLSRKVNIHHAAIQGAFFTGFSAMVGFGPVLLLCRGLSNSALGAVTSASLLIPCFLQLALASLSDADSRFTPRRLVLGLSLVTLLTGIAMWLGIASKTALLVCYTVICVCLITTSPFFNSMVMAFHVRGVPVNYGLGRGTGSVAYAVVALIMGFVVERRPPTVIVPVMLAALVLQLAAVWTFRYPLPPVPAADGQKPAPVSLSRLLKRYPSFLLLVLGCALLQGGHNVSNTYMVHIAAKAGAGESLMGVILALSAAMELPAMSLFPRMRRRFSLRALFCLSAAMFAVRQVLFLLASSPVLLYTAAVLQFFEFGLFLPCTVYYTAEKLDAANQVKGQGLIHICANGLGPAVMTAIGGRLVDSSGINALLAFTAAGAAAGTLLVALATANHPEKEGAPL